MSLKLKFLYCYILSLLIPISAIAADNFTTAGYIDASYNYLVRNHQFINSNNDRLNDLTQNGFTLQQAVLTATMLPEQGMGWLVTLLLGRDAYFIAPAGQNPYYGSQTLGFTFPQAFLQWVQGQNMFFAGVFDTAVGEESNLSDQNVNFSHSILDDYAEPGVMFGLRDIFKINDKIKLNAGLNNGWSGIRDIYHPDIELGVDWLINSILTLSIQGLTSEQRLINYSDKSPFARRNFVNTIATFLINPALTFTLSGDYGVQSKAVISNENIQRAVWEGLAAYVSYRFNDQWRTSFRAEWYDDQDGYTTGLHQNWREATITLGYIPLKNLELRIETRHDFSNKNVFMNVSGQGVNKNQQSYAIEGIYKI